MSDPTCLGADSTLTLIALTEVEQDGEFVVGDPGSGTFVNLPPVGMEALRLLREGLPLHQVGDRLAAGPAGDVDILDFAETLVDLGFVAAVDGVGVPKAQPEVVPPDGRPVGAPPRPRGRWLFGRTAWTVYGVLAVCCLLIEIGDPRLRLSSQDFLFINGDPVASLAGLTVLSFAVAALHEGSHWLAARVQGVSATFSIGRRQYFLVFETDLTQLWTLPRGRRYGPLLAGMAFDTTALASALLARHLLAPTDPAAVSTHAGQLLAALCAVLCVNLLWQFAVFLRNDLYAVMITWLGCVNLWRVTQLLAIQRLRALHPDELDELTNAHPRDRRAARWYSWVCLLGTIAAVWFAFEVPLRVVLTVLRWMLTMMTTRPITSVGFWEAVGLTLMALLPQLMVLGVFLRERRQRRDGRRAAVA